MMRMPGGMPMKANLQQQIANRNLYVGVYYVSEQCHAELHKVH